MTIGCALALPAVAALLAGVTADVEVGAGAEGRGTRYAPVAGEVTSRAAAATTPRLGLLADGAVLHLELRYAPTFWSSDVSARPSALVSHAVSAGLEARPDAPWRLALAARALRGETDPLAGVPGAASSQLVSTGPVPFEQLHADGRAELQLDPRTALRGLARWDTSRVLRGGLGDLFPPQRGAGGEAGLARRLTERDTLDVRATGEWNETDAAGGTTTALSGAAEAAWRRALTPRDDGWVRAGAGFARADPATGPLRRSAFPAAGVGWARAAADRLSGELTAGVGAFVDRFTGDVGPIVDGRCAVRAPLARRLVASGQASAARRLDGETTLAAADARLAWTVGTGVVLEGGALWRLQRERRPELPSFSELGVFAGVQVSTTRRGAAPPP